MLHCTLEFVWLSSFDIFGGLGCNTDCTGPSNTDMGRGAQVLHWSLVTLAAMHPALLEVLTQKELKEDRSATMARLHNRNQI